MIRHLVIFVTTLTLTGCMTLHVHPPSPGSNTITTKVDMDSLISTPEDNTPPPAEPTVIEKVVEVNGEECERFYWPKTISEPPKASFVKEVMENRDQYSAERINEILLDYIVELRAYMDLGYAIIREEYMAYLARCEYVPRRVLPDKLYP